MTTPRTDALDISAVVNFLQSLGSGTDCLFTYRGQSLNASDIKRLIDFARQLEGELAAAQEENAKLKAEITRVMQAAANGGYCRRNHAKCECKNIAESIRTDE